MRDTSGLAQVEKPRYNLDPMGNPSVLTFLLLLRILLGAGPETENQAFWRWPLEIDGGISSTFMEFRSTHFHGGVDLRTFQKTGWPVLAPVGGCVTEISGRWTGEGLSLVLQTDRGEEILFFHLSRLEPRLEALAMFRRRELGTWAFGALKLERPLAVVAGEVLAYTGESGAGGPHLHVEVRDASGVRLNPLDRWQPLREDKNPPRLDYLLIRPWGGTLVGGGSGDGRIALKAMNRNEVPPRVVVTGPFDLFLSCRDVSDSGRPVAPDRVEAFWDDEPLMLLDARHFVWEDHNQLFDLFDAERSVPGQGVYRLTGHPAGRLGGVAEGPPWSERMAHLEPGAHRVRLRVTDHQGQYVETRVAILILDVQRLQGMTGECAGGVLRCQGLCAIPEDMMVDAGVWSRRGGRWISLAQVSAQRAEVLNGRPLSVPTPAQAGGVRLLLGGEPVWQSACGQESFRSITRQPVNTWEHRLVGDTWTIHLPEGRWSPRVPSLVVKVGDRVCRIRALPGETRGLSYVIRGSELGSGFCHVSWEDGAVPEGMQQESWFLLRLLPGQGFTRDCGGVVLEGGARSVEVPTLLLCMHTRATGEQQGIIHLLPRHQGFRDRVRLGWRSPRLQPQCWFPAAGRQDRQGRWHWGFRGANRESERTWLTVRSGGSWRLMQDQVPPTLRWLGFRGEMRNPAWCIRDKGSGVFWSGVVVRVNGSKALFDVDVDRGILEVREAAWRVGGNRVEVFCRDQAGHSKRQVRTLWRKSSGSWGKKADHSGK